MKTKPLKFSEVWPEKMGEWAGEETYFVEKIINAIDTHNIVDMGVFDDSLLVFGETGHHKLHTIRRGKKYKAGDIITPISVDKDGNEFQFAPEMKIVSVQDIGIKYKNINGTNIGVPNIYLDGHNILGRGSMLSNIIKNEGFENPVQFFKCFDKDFKGQILHFTDLRY